MKSRKNNNRRNNTSRQIQQLRTEVKNDRKDLIVDKNSSAQNPKRIVTMLPDIEVQPILCYTRRFIASSATSSFITIGDLINTWLVAINTTTLYPIGASYRLKKIRFLAPVQTQGTTVTLWLRPNPSGDSTNNSFNSVPKTYLDTSASIDKPAYIQLKPSLDTPLGAWHSSTTVNSTLLFVSYPQGTTVDMFMEVIPNMASAPLGYTATVAGAVAGTQYCRNVNSVLVPVGINNI